jgi:hypothetical protein
MQWADDEQVSDQQARISDGGDPLRFRPPKQCEYVSEYDCGEQHIFFVQNIKSTVEVSIQD